MKNETEFAVHPLSTSQVHYQSQKLRRRDGYSGPGDNTDEAHARALLIELLDYFGGSEGFSLPPPPMGLPGTGSRSFDQGVMNIIQLGFDYFAAIANEQPRRQWNIHEAVHLELLRRENKGHRECEEKVVARALEHQAEERRKADALPDRVAYFIRGTSGPIKIGSATNPLRRLKELQTSHHEPLSVLAICEGGEEREREYHKLFSAHRLHGEWFAPHADILSEIERLNPSQEQAA